MASSPWASQAALDTLLKFGPQKSVLGQLAREAQEQYVGTVQGSAGAAGETVQAIKQAQPQVAAIYNNAGLGATQTGSLLGSDLSKLGAAADPIKAAAATEQAGALANLQRGKSQALGELVQRAVQAKEGGQFAANQAATVLGKQLGKISSQKTELGGEEGAYNVSDLEKLTHEHEDLQQKERDLQQKERASERSAGLEPGTKNPIPGGKLDKPAASEHLTLKEQDSAASTIDSIKSTAEKFRRFATQKGHQLDRSQLAELLSEGQPSESVGTGKLDATGKEIKQRTPAVPAFKADVLMSAALDVAENGHLQKGTEDRLHKAGYSIAKLGLPTYGEWVAKGGPQQEKKLVNEAAKAIGIG